MKYNITENGDLSVMPPSDFRELLNALDGAASTMQPDHDGRRAKRLIYRSLDVTVKILARDPMEERTIKVTTRNLSAGGLAFIHDGVLSIGQQLHIDIPLIEDRILLTAARVVRCRHVSGMLHEIGVEFLGVRRM